MVDMPFGREPSKPSLSSDLAVVLCPFVLLALLAPIIVWLSDALFG
ncbi:hypothetical protein [Phenylobacterium sp.]|nr:hypothetical protein [Phenylobacterium sp.]